MSRNVWNHKAKVIQPYTTDKQCKQETNLLSSALVKTFRLTTRIFVVDLPSPIKQGLLRLWIYMSKREQGNKQHRKSIQKHIAQKHTRIIRTLVSKPESNMIWCHCTAVVTNDHCPTPDHPAPQRAVRRPTPPLSAGKRQALVDHPVKLPWPSIIFHLCHPLSIFASDKSKSSTTQSQRFSNLGIQCFAVLFVLGSFECCHESRSSLMDVQLVWMPGRPAIDESGVRKVCHTSFHTPILESSFEQYIGEG